jgi:putative oxidoreductase
LFDGFSDVLIFDQRLFWVLCLMLLIVKGAGKFSLDYLLGIVKASRQQE